ncbi:uncharacterized protein LOC130762008 [Actinidia eriantha]|uniref:uncharacterized protein LOC130762008 n=1 Tax=Actinidia eriantha TaxID=165200 RepID=UPI002590B46A|nr:uncharacterized protein LOC130762008 [Actinidia eriantha]
MAVRCFPPPSALMIKKIFPTKKLVKKLFMLTQSQVSVKKTTQLQIRSYSRNKIFEDQFEGIVCYRDDSGEIICEGYDEGPRLPTMSYHPSDAEVIDLLQTNWFQIVGDNCDAGQKVFNWNGFNTLCLYVLAMLHH